MDNFSPFLRSRLETVLTAALKAPGNRERFQHGGLITPDDTLVRDWRDRFLNLPVLKKEVIRQAPGQFLATVEDIVYRGSTSGSRGEAYLFFAGSQWNQQRLKSRRQLWEWWRIDDNTPIINLASRLLPSRVPDLSVFGAINRDCEDLLFDVLERESGIIRGYPSRLCEIASLIKMQAPYIKAVICTGEPLFEQQKALLENCFQAPVINEYGCHEAAVSGWTCPEVGRIHLDENRCYYETRDDNLIVTDLWNETMPLIRYQVGDRIQLYPDSCPCGRLGLTGEFWGRSEDKIGTREGFKAVGKVAMPPLPGILHYRIERESALHVHAGIQPDPKLPQTHFIPFLETWIRETFGEVELALTAFQSPPPPQPPIWDDAEWLEMITQASWSKWLVSGAMPVGEAKETAKLLKNLISPQIIGVILPSIIQQEITQLAQSPVSSNPTLENLKGRVLLLACSCIQESQTAVTFYHQACQRLKNANKKATLDRLIPILHLPLNVVNPPAIALDFPTSYPLDSLNIYHLLAAFETALHRCPPSKRPFAPRLLHPPLAVLLGDLSAFASNFTLAHLQHWVEFVRGQSLPFTTSETPLPPKTAAWLQWRSQLIRNPSQATPQLQHLESLAQTSSEQARFYLEKGYHHILTQTPLDPTEWLAIIETHAGKLTEKTADLTPWMPIVAALVKPLYQQNQHDLAYRCLVAASLSTRQKSAFERLTNKYNQKQAILTDITPWTATNA
ncbi:MAG: hypothetical protein SAJ12_01970 [Jaaginema sp. PMC 1079.18]|nr:hypothetical protein [Jaaginema sp. PMC 1080.18]MEC4849754.1 hypothetical protein [Jaaginema sp. PMC 1079.18]MEC4866618.1 hypothetical protein [Jaaginema sp. PMC 1078.18]